MRRLLLGMSACILVLGLIIGLWLINFLNTPLQLPDDQQYLDVKRGMTVGSIAQRLYVQKHIPSPRLFTLYARLLSLTEIKAGEYRLPPRITLRELLEQLVAGDVITYQWTLVEGWNAKQVLASLSELANIQQTLATADDLLLFAKDEQVPGLNFEGWWFPDTYHYHKDEKDTDLLRRAYQQMTSVLSEEWEQRDVDLPYENAYEALIMASIVEKETGVAHERGAIAGVFVRRLQKKMRLQTDPTVIYGLGEDYQGNLRRKHLRQVSPYNTYMIAGLPPTPIAMPGREAIVAALHPEAGDALYFVAKGDGTHQFSATLAEHEKAVKEYQINQRRVDYRSTIAK